MGIVSHEYLGLFDTPPTRRETRIALVLIGLLLVAFVTILPFHDIRVGESIPFVPVVDSVVFAGELIIAALLYAQAAIFRSRALTLLASGFLFIALLIVGHALTFPGAFAPDGLLGAGRSSAAWMMIVRRLSLPIAVILYALLKTSELAAAPDAQRRPTQALGWASGALALAAAVAAVAIRRDDLLPSMFVGRSDPVLSNLAVFNFSNIGLVLVAIAILFRNRKSLLDMWLLVALSGELIQSVLNLPIHARFTVGWYCLFVLILVSHLVVLLALIIDSNRLYARLALSTAARNRERATRMMSMEAVAAAISQEVGQPLAGVTLSASAGLSWLAHAKPNSEMAIRAMQDALEAANRTFDVIRSVRATFAKGRGRPGELCLNELVRETLSSLAREVAAHRISVQLDLDETLPPILANRAQMQHVLLNLLANAIESLVASGRRPRRIEVRSTAAEGNVLLEISDPGAGAAPEPMPDSFDPFFPSEAAGTGLGLSLSRATVEEHGGMLWTSRSERHGATFHLRLPCNGGAAARRRDTDKERGEALPTEA